MVSLSEKLFDELLLLRRVVISQFRNQKISLVKFIALVHIWDFGGGSIKDIAKLMNITMASASSLVKGMEKAGLVERALSPNDRRASIIKVSPSGKEILKKAREHITQGTFEKLSQAEKETLLIIFKKIKKSF